MSEIHSKHIIIGAGLSGLTAARELLKHQEKDVIILESRDRIGGRIYTKDAIELGATWYQNHHTNLSKLVNELEIETFDQFSKGQSVLVYSSMAPPHYFETDQNAPAAKRIGNGSTALIKALSKNMESNIVLNTTVTHVKETKDKLIISTDNRTYTCEKLIISMPPKIVNRINFDPELPFQLKEALNNTHTWMSNAIKVGITFNRPFWRDKNLSGTLIGQIGPAIELYDHCNIDNTKFSLKGFVNEGLRDLTPDDRKERILSYLETYFGTEIREYINYYEKDWSKDKYTSCESLKSVYMSPNYGNPVFQKLYMNNKLIFSGAETSPVHGGYMDGAVYSGISAVELLLK